MTTGAVTGAALLLVPVVLLGSLAASPERDDSLRVAEQPTAPPATPSAEPQPAPEPEATPPADGAASPAAQEPDASPQAGQQADPESGSTTGEDEEESEPQAAELTFVREFRVTRETVPYAADSCQYPAGVLGASGGWCTGSPGAFSTRTGESVALRVLLCRPTGSGARDARFDFAREAVFRVYGGSPERSWTSSKEQDRQPHTVTVQAGTCLRWTVVWDARDDGAEVLPPGRYTYEPQVDAELSDQSGGYAGFDYEFTVTE
jgi:hypothetical protein